MSSESEIEVNFGGKSIKIDKEKDAKPIITALKNNLSMTTFCLSGNTIGVDGSCAIGHQLEKHKDLKRCLFSDMFTGRMADEIAPSLKHMSMGIMASGAQLTELDLSDNAFGPRGVVGVTELLGSPICFSLKILRMNNQGLGHQGARHLAEALSNGIKASNSTGLKLQHFSAGRNRLENVGACLLADVFSQMGSLEELHLYQNGIGIHGIDGVKALVNAVAKNPRLRVLNLSDNSLKVEGGIEISNILPLVPKLQELILDDCLIRSRGCRALARVFERDDVVPELSRLSLCGNEIQSSAGVSLALSLASKSNLTMISLNANEFGPSGIENVIYAFNSVDLISAIEAGVCSRDEENKDDENSILDACHQAFDEDQGDASDNDDDYGEVDESDPQYEDYESEDEDEQENSFDMIKDKFGRPAQDGDVSLNSQSGRGSTGGFSFLSCMSNLQKEAPPRTNLFVGLNTVDSSVNTNKLFGSHLNTPTSMGLFNSPKFPVQSPADSTSFNGTNLFSTPPAKIDPFNELDALQSIEAALVDTENDALLKSLVEKNLNPPSTYTWIEKSGKISSASPESVVRLAFQISKMSNTSSCRGLASHLLFTACTRKNDSTGPPTLISPSARAVNRILVHLGAIKPDRSDSVERIIANDVETHLPASIELVTNLLNRYGQQLSPEVRPTLTLLIAQHRKNHSAFESLLDTLEGKLSNLSVS